MNRPAPISQYRSVPARMVMPPMPEAAPPAPALSMAEDAKRCNARLRTHIGGSNTAGQEQSRKARVIREAKEANVLAAITAAPSAVADIMAVTGLADSAVRSAIEVLRQKRLVIGRKVAQAYVYRVVE